MVKIIESPREGMQGVRAFIPAATKVRFINSLLNAGFDTVEVGSIVNPRIIPQMSDTLEVIRRLDISTSRSNRMALVMSRKGAEKVISLDVVTALSYPFAFSASFLEKNVRSTVDQAFKTTGEVINLCEKHGKKAVIYISYAFGNPYGDPWSIELLLEWIGKLRGVGARVIALSNVSVEIDAPQIREVFTAIIREYPSIEFGLHLHHGKGEWILKVEAAWDAGCRRYDTVIKGFGGCPMSGQELMGNLDTLNLVSFLEKNHVSHHLDLEALNESIGIADEIYRN